MPPRHVLFLFLDGVGLGPNQPANPLTTVGPHFALLSQCTQWTLQTPTVHTPSHVFRPVDATLQTSGLPQSGTGQASLFSGVNCAARAGRHFGPFPHSTSKPILKAQNIFQRLQPEVAEHGCAFANAYPPVFFEKRAQSNRWTVTTLCSRQAGVRLRSTEDVRTGRALTADIVGAAWQNHLNISIPHLSPFEAGQQLYRLMQAHRFTLFEYYETDKAGHGRSALSISTILHRLDALLKGILDAFSPAHDLLLLCSDHGNLEAPDQKPHTRHPVPLVAYGCGAGAFSDATSITDVVPTLVDLVTNEMPQS